GDAQAVGRDRLVRVDDLVDLRDHRRERAQPGKLLVVEQEMEQLAGGKRPLALLVSAALAGEGHARKGPRPAAEHPHPVAVLIPDSPPRLPSSQTISASSSPMLAAAMSTS